MAREVAAVGPGAGVVAVIGGGWAGCAAAVALAQRNLRVAMYEAGAVLGGRARRVMVDGLPLDNGQHLLLGAYAETRAVVAAVHGGFRAAPWSAQPLAIAPLARTQGNALAMRAWNAPAPFGLLAGLLCAHGLTWAERLGTVRWFARLKRRAFRCPAAQSVAELLADTPPRATELLWAPLCIAALNTPPERASAQVFANVLRAAFDGTRAAADILWPATDLSALVPEAVQRWLEGAGHAVHLRTTASVLGADANGVRLQAGASEVEVTAALVAVGPHQLARAFAPGALPRDPRVAHALALTEKLVYEPIVTVYLGYRHASPLPPGLVRLDDAPGQWVFDRADILARAGPGAPACHQLLAVVISAHGPHDALDHAALVAATDTQLRRLRPTLPPLAWSQVIAEQRATYACTPGVARPAAGAIAPRLYLAGDYTDTEFPATLEAAVRSGRRAAEALAAELSLPPRG